MANEPVYKCSTCGAHRSRAELTVKKSVFLEMGEGARTLRSRVIGWLCKGCLSEDADYNRPAQVERKGVNVGG